ncbi:MAG: oligoendopeptidase F [bacterium]|nr:oligoendopeptidase F [bacterium]
MAEKLKKREEVNNNFKWDLTTIYNSINDFEDDYKKVKKYINDFPKHKNIFMENGENLYNLLKQDCIIDDILNKLYMYAHLNKDSDTTNVKYQKLFERVSNIINEYNQITSFIVPTLLKYDYSKIQEFYVEYPLLIEFKFSLEKVFRNKEHILSEKEECIISNLQPMLEFPEKIYDLFTNAELCFGNIKDEEGNIVEITDSNFSLYIKSKDRKVRKDAFTTLYNGYSKYKNTISLMLANDIKANNIMAKLRHFDTAMKASLFSDNIDTIVYDNLVNTVENNLDVLFKYYNLKKEILNLDEFHLYDIYAPLMENESNRYTFEEAKEIVKKALSILGDEYSNNLDKAFNEKWIDIYPNVGKVSGAYSSGSYSTNPFVLLNFQGELNDISTLAHELGHSMHSYYSRKNNTYQDSQYKIFVAEVASTVNELLLSNYLLEHSKDRNEKLSILNRLLELYRTTIYRQTMFSSFEKEIYDKASNGEILTSDVICDTYYEINKKYFGDIVVVDNEIRYEWEKVPHFYYNFYVYKYATGLSAACHIVNRILNKEKNAVSDYIRFLKSGGSMYPLDELKLTHVDMTDKQVIESAIKMFDDAIEKFKELYKEK